MLAAITGQTPDRVPFVPRLEFWHRAHRRNGTLPAGLEELNLREIADHLGAGYYQVIPDLTRSESELDMLDYALGIPRTPALLYEVCLADVERRVLKRGRETVIEYHTPVGSIRTATILTDEMLEGGVSVPWRTEYPLQKPEDFDVVGYIYSHLEVIPRVDRYAAQVAAAGDGGIVVAWVAGSACPMHQLLREMMPVEEFFYALHDYPEKVHALVEQMEPHYARIKEICASSDAEVLLLGGNYDDAITYPPFFREHILPPLRDFAVQLHQKGKYLMTHTDGENRRLMPLYLETGFDGADSVCPHPMTSLKLDEVLDAFSDKITVMGGIPSTMLCTDSASRETFRAFVDELATRYRRHPRLILGVSDMVTADADWDRLRYLADRLA